jgi:NitT/TauT family transport system substrate-binding protein
MKIIKKHLLRLLVLIIVVAQVACIATPASPTARPMDKVSLQLQWVTQAQFAGYYVALDKGWYAEEGIDLKIVPGAPDVVPVELVLAGTRDFATGLLADLAVAVQAKKGVISLAQIQQKNGLMLVTKKSSGIEKPQDFVGKKVGVWLGGWEAQFWALMAQAGVDKTQFELVAQGYSMEPFLNGELDVASAMIYNEYYAVLESGVKAEELNLIDYADYGLGFPGDTFFTSTSMMEQNPDLCARMVRASLRGWKYAVENPEAAVDIVLKYDDTGMQTRTHQLSMMNEIAKLVQVGGQPLGKTNESNVKVTIETLLKYGILAGSINPGDVFTNQFWTDQLEQ